MSFEGTRIILHSELINLLSVVGVMVKQNVS